MLRGKYMNQIFLWLWIKRSNLEDGITKFVAESCAAYNMELDKAFDQIKIHFIGH